MHQGDKPFFAERGGLQLVNPENRATSRFHFFMQEVGLKKLTEGKLK